MNEPIGEGTELPATVPAADDAPPADFGARLKWERERIGLTVTDVAARLRLHLNQVRALEQEALASLPEAAYVRGFVRSYARVLEIDPAPLLDDLSAKIGPATRSVVDGMAQQRDYSPVRAAAREHASRRFVMLGAVLLLVVLAALGWYAMRERTASVPATPRIAAAPVIQTPAPQTAAPMPAADATAAAAPVPVSSGGSMQPVDAPAAVLEPVPATPLLKLRFSGPSWAEVKDAEGKVLHSQHNTAGGEFVIEGTPPFYVVIGDTTKTVVEVRGETFDTAPYTRQNVARFTIN
jgi:cytoskeleton protein RodZ